MFSISHFLSHVPIKFFVVFSKEENVFVFLGKKIIFFYFCLFDKVAFCLNKSKKKQLFISYKNFAQSFSYLSASSGA